MDFTIHPALDKANVLGCSDGDRLLIVVEPGVGMTVLGLRHEADDCVRQMNLLASGHRRTGLCIADGFIIVVGISFLDALGKCSNNAVVLDSSVELVRIGQTTSP